MERGKRDYSTKIFVIIILVVFVASGFAIASFSGQSEEEESEAIEISGYTFYAAGEGYKTKTDDGREITFFSDPRKMENISISKGAVDAIRFASKVYIAYNPNQEAPSNARLAYAEIGMVTYGLLGIETVEAFSEDSDPPNMNVPLKTCSDTTASVPVIEIRLGDKTEVRKEGDCVIVEGASLEGQRLAADKLAMHLAGIEV